MSHKNRKIKRFVYLFIFIIFFSVASIFFFYGNCSVYNILKNKKIIKNLGNDNEQLNTRVENLKIIKGKLKKKDLSAIEKVAREQYGMAKKGEKIFYITNSSKNKTGQ